MNMNHNWHTQHSIEVNATAETIWQLFRDVASWKQWNNGIEEITIEGPFAGGTWFTMKPTGWEAVRSQLVDVKENQGFVDETRLGDVVIWVAHRLERLSVARTRVIYAVDVAGPGADEIGPAISSDFPDVLAALAKRAEQRSAEVGQ